MSMSLANSSSEVAGSVDFEEALGGRIDETKVSGLIESEDGRVELGDDPAEERGGLERAEALRLMHVGECVDFDGEIAEGIIAAGSAGAKGVVLFAQGGDNVGERLQRANDLIHEGGDGEEHSDDDDGEDAEDGGRRKMLDDEQNGEQDENDAAENSTVDAEPGFKAEGFRVMWFFS